MLFYLLVSIAIISILYVFNQTPSLGFLFTIGKKIIALIYLTKFKKKHKPLYEYDLDVKDVQKVGAVANEEECFLENPRALNSDLNAGDTIEFWGIDNNGNALVVHLTRRHDRCAETWVYLKLKSGEEYQSIVHPDTWIYNTDGKTFSAAGLTFECLEAMRRWRIIFRGTLRKGIRNTWDPIKGEELKVCMNFAWHSGYHSYSLRQHFDINSVADTISKSQFPLSKLINYNVDPEDRTEQWGQMIGSIQIENSDEIKINLWGPKTRTHGTQKWSNINRRLRLHIHSTDGSVMSLYSSEELDGIKNMTHGFVVQAANICLDVMSKITAKPDFPVISDNDKAEIKFTAGCKNHSLSYHTLNWRFRVYGGLDWEREISTTLIQGTFDDEPMVGFIELVRPHYGHCPLPRRKSLACVQDLCPAPSMECDSQVIQLTDVACRNCDLVGGKGASLAFMMALKENGDFEVPSGVCVTNVAYRNYISKRSSILSAILRLENIAWKKTKGCLQTQCQTVMDAITKSTFPFETKDFIHDELQRTFGNDYEQLKFAVRSSAIGEDGEETSAAGQNETFLGMKGLDQICDAALKCWASQFSFRSVEYKRKNGQLLNAGMAVVIQQMVPSDVSGVIFTTDPVTGSYGYITVTANYGLGESVVSGASEPDTIVIRRSWDDHLKVIKTDIGKKNVKIILKNDGGTEEQTTDLKEASKCSLKDKKALKLAKVAVYLENSYGTPRDIEWAMHKKKIYLLQCRPITTHLQETQHELIHEFDSCRVTENERYTTANVGEVLPGALSPLALSIVMKIWFLCGQRTMRTALKGFTYNPLPVTTIGSIVFCNHFLADRIFQKVFGLSKKVSPILSAIQLGIYGRIVNDSEVHQMTLKRFEIQNFWYGLKSFYETFLKSIIFGARQVDSMLKKYDNYEVPLDGITDAESVYRHIEHHLFDMDDMLYPHIKVSTASMMWNFMILNTLGSSSNNFTLDNYNDFSNLIGRANGAISGDVPFSLEELAKTIAKENKNAFPEMSPEMALNWLEISSNESKKQFQEFLQRHGHRGYKELEMSSIPWKKQPLKLIQVLQPMVSACGSPKTIENQETTDDNLSNLKTPLTYISKKILKFVLGQSRKSILYREKSKSLLVKGIDGTRNGYLKLGEILVNEGKLSDEDMIFFLTYGEIGQLIKERSSRIIKRAAQRKRLYPYMDSLHFPEFVNGEPKINDELEESAHTNGTISNRTKINAYPVCQGTAKGPARVVIKFDDVDQIKPGDILITYATDIAWSPYFPMLGGVVTEIGGLVSHGAVVAREYGLPCVVGADGATKIFKSGEMVFLNATKGTLEKCSDENS